MTNRKNTRIINVGNVQIGNQDKVVIQSMCNTKTKDTINTITQINRLEEYGCDIARVAILDHKDAEAIKIIKKGTNLPLVADIHFDYKLALLCIENGIDKIRINPGNIGSNDKIKKVVDACKSKNIPIRIGVNAGSLEKDLIEKYDGPSVEGMIESAKRHISLLEQFDFKDIAISLKSSDMLMAVKAYKEFSKLYDYPTHIGITEAGSKFSGTIKSSIGLGMILNEGIGDTIRVSLSCDPVEEIKVCKEILSNFDLYSKPELISCPTCGRLSYDMLDVLDKVEKYLETTNKDIKVAIMGCVVNGPGEAKGADIALCGGKDKGALYYKGEFLKSIDSDDMYNELIKLIEKV